MSTVSAMRDRNKRPLKFIRYDNYEEPGQKSVGDLPDSKFSVRSISYEVQKKDGMMILIGLPKLVVDDHVAVIPFPISRLKIESSEEPSRIMYSGR